MCVLKLEKENIYVSSCPSTLHRLCIADDGVQRLLLWLFRQFFLWLLLHLLSAVVRLLAEAQTG